MKKMGRRTAKTTAGVNKIPQEKVGKKKAVDAAEIKTSRCPIPIHRRIAPANIDQPKIGFGIVTKVENIDTISFGKRGNAEIIRTINPATSHLLVERNQITMVANAAVSGFVAKSASVSPSTHHFCLGWGGSSG